jgi:alpha-1,6-mannosyltransferase
MLTILDVLDSTAEDARAYWSEKLAYLQDRTDLRYVAVVPDVGTWTSVRGQGLIEHVEAPLRPGSGSERTLISGRALRDLVQLHRPSVIECGSPAVLPMLIQLAAGRLEPRPALIGHWHGDLSRAWISPAVGPRIAAAGERAADWWSRTSYAGLDAVLVPSRDEAQMLFARGVDRLYLTPMGIDAERFAPQRRASELVERLRAGVDSRVIVWTDAEPAIAGPIYAQLCRRTSHDPALLLGGSDQAANHRFAAARAHVHALDGELDRASVIASCDVGLLLGGAGACAEAMAAGLPIVARTGTRAGELVRESGCGRVLAAQPITLAEAALTLASASDRAELGGRGRTWIRRFDWPSCFERTLLVYQEVIDHVRRGRRVPIGIHERPQPQMLTMTNDP